MEGKERERCEQEYDSLYDELEDEEESVVPGVGNLTFVGLCGFVRERLLRNSAVHNTYRRGG